MKAPNLPAVEAGGLITGMSKDRKQIYYNSEDTHSLVLGATRCGKTRTTILPSVGLTAFAGESMVVIDMKGEIYGYTHPFLERLGYECITIDFNDPQRSDCYNFLQPCIDAVNCGNIPKAVETARDIATILVPDKSTSETIWTDGARSVLTSAILAVVVDNPWKPQYQNLANVQQFITHMCESDKNGNMPLYHYIEGLAENHPVKMAEGLSKIAPDKMRGSFYAQALVALDMFTDPHIHGMTAATDFDMEQTGSAKRAVFVILPDHKKTYHSLAALFVKQHYQVLVEVAGQRGGRLQNRVQFFCDEFGNFVKIPEFETILTVSGGRGMKFHIVLQDLNQLDEKYGDKLGKTIRSNCETWIYLKSDDPLTTKELSDRCGKYTIKTPSLSGSSGGQSSASYNLTGRSLLMPEEIAKIQRPFQLVMSRENPAIMYSPDIGATVFNELFGMGDEEENRQLLLRRLQERELRFRKPAFWGIWNEYKRNLCIQKASEEFS